MNPLKTIASGTLILCACFTHSSSFAQDKAKHTFGKVTPADFNLPATPVIDSNADAVVLSDIGEVHYVGNKNDWFSSVYTRQTRIKILRPNAFGLATIKILLRGQEEKAEALSSIAASTFNLENGQVNQTKFEQKDLYRNKLSSEQTQVKLTLPAVKAGSIIEYSYTIRSDYSSLLPSWDFQWTNYPCLYSEYQVDIPMNLTFMVVRQGTRSFDVDKGSTGHANYMVTYHLENQSYADLSKQLHESTNTVKHVWVMTNVPSFGDEKYLTTPANYVDRVSFQLSKTNDSQDSYDYINTWAGATNWLLESQDFGAPLQQDLIKVGDLATKITSEGGDPLTQAKAIYYYVSRHFTCTDFSNKYISSSLNDVIATNKGSVGDINLLLIALLDKKGYRADPVLLSTREYGFSPESYPLISEMNYVVARLNVDGQTYYLDAAHPELGFGRLADDCYNGHAQVISNKDPGSVYFVADSLKESKTTMVMLSGSDKGFEGEWQSTPGMQQSYAIRSEIAKIGEPQYFKNIQTGYGEEMEIHNGSVDSLDRLEDPVKVHFEFALKQTPGPPLLYLNPMIGAGMHQNPFQEAERKYPVELPYATDETYILMMDIPQGYVVDELPKSVRVGLNDNQGQFEYLVGQQGAQIQLKCRLRLNKARFPATDYANLRDFCAYVVKKEAEQIVLKKK